MLARITFTLGIAGLAGVYALQYFGFTPCDLCIKQRILVAIMIGCSLFGIIAARFNKKLAIVGDILITIAVCGMLALAVFQVGVEKHIFALPGSCTHGIADNQTMDDLRATLLSPKSLTPSCDIPQILFGVSIATWSLIGVFVLLLIIARHWFLKFKH